MLGLYPDEFSRLQVHEFNKVLEGYNEREKAKDIKTAYFVSWLVSSNAAKPVPASTIIEPLYPEEKEQEEQRRIEEEKALKERFGLK